MTMRTDSSSTPASGSILTSSSAAHQGEPSHASRLQRVSSSSYFDIANTILGSSGDLDEVLLCAARDGDLNKLEQLLCQRNDIIVDIDCKDRRTGNTALILAAKKGYAKMIQLLLRHGADPTLHNYEAQTALEVATSATKTILLDWVNRSTECTHRLLLQAAWQGNLEVIRRLLVVNKSLDINCQNAEGLTPLLLVAKDVQLFERLGVQLNRRYNPVEVAELLIKARANIHALDNDGKTCLHHAAQSRAGAAEKLVHAFITCGSDVDQLDKRQYAAIHWASHFGNVNVALALLDGGSEVNCRGFAGLTPLHISAHNDHQLTAVTLLQHGADITLTDDRGMTAVDLAKTRKMKTTLREAWAEATQKCKPAELGPVRVTSREESKLYMHEENHKPRKGEVVFEGMVANSNPAQRTGQLPSCLNLGPSLSRAMTKGRRAEQQTLQDIENGKYTPTPVYSRESTRPLGTVRTKMPSILPQISKQSPSPAGCQSPESPPAGSRNAAEDLRRSLEDGRNMLGQRSQSRRGPVRAGRLSGSTPLSTSEKMDDNTRDNFSAIDMNMRPVSHRRSGSDPVSTTSIGDLAVSADNIISRRGRSVSTGDGESCEMGGTSTERMSQLRTPLDRDTTMCVNIPPMIPEGNSPRNPTNVLSFERNVTNSQGSTMPVQIIPLPPNSSRILPPTPTFLTQGSFIAVEGALAKAMKDDDSLSSKEPSPRSDDDDDNKIRMVLANPMELFRSRSLLKEEFILAESRPSDIVVGSSGSDPASSCSSLSSSSLSPRDLGFSGHMSHRASDPSLVSLTLREKAASLGARSGIHQNRRSDPSLVNLGETKGLAGQSSVRNANISPKSQKDCKGADAAEKGMKCSASDTVLGSGFLSTAECGETFSNLNKNSCSTGVVRSQSLKTRGQRGDVEKHGGPSELEVSQDKERIKRSWSIGNVAAETGAQINVANSVVKSMQNSSTAQGAPFSGKGQLVIMRDSFQNVSSMSSTSETVCLQKQIKNLDKKLEDDIADSSQIVLGSGVGSVEAGAAVRERKDVTVKPSSGDVVSLIQNVPGPCVSETYPKNSERKETGGSKVCDTSKPSVGSKTNDHSKPGVFSRSGISSSYSSLTPSSAVSKSMKHFNKDVSKKVSNKIKETASTSTSPKTCSDTIKSASKSSNIVSSVSHSSVPRPVSSAILLSSFESTSESNIASSLQTKSPSSENLSSHMPAPSAEKKPAEVTARCKTSESTQKKDGVTAGGAKYCSANTRATLARGLEGNSRSPASSECKNAKIPPTNLCQTSCPEPSQKVSSDLASSKASSLATSSSACVTALTEKNTNKVERDVMKGSSLGPSSAKSKNITKNSQGSMCAEPGSRRTVTPSSSQGTILMKDTQMSSEITSGRKTSASQGEPCSRQANLAKAASADPPAHKTTNTADGAICRPQASLVNSDYSHGTQSKMAPTKKSEHSFLSKAVPEDKFSKNQAEVQKDDKNEHDIEPLVKITFGKIDSRAAAALRCPSDPAVFKSTPVIVNPFEHLPVCQSVKDNCPRHVTMAEKPSKDAGLCKGKKGKPSRSTKRGREKRPVSGSSRQASAGRRGRKSREGKASEGVESRPRSGKTIGRARSGKRRTKKQADKQEDTEDNLAEVATKGDVALISGIGWHLATPCVDTSDIHAASSIHYSSSDFEDSDDTESVADDDKVCEYLDVRQGQVSTSPRFREVKGEGGKADVTIPVMLNDGFPPMNLDMTLMNSNARPQSNGVRSTSSDAEDNGAKVSAVLNDELADLEHIRDITTKDMLLGKLTPIPEIPSLSGVCEAIARFDHCLKEGQLSQLLEGAVQEKKDSALPYTKGGNDSSSCGPEMDLQTRKLNNSGLNLLESASTMDVCAKQNFERDPENTHIIVNEDSTENKVKKERKFSESKKDEEEINIAIDEILSATSTSMSSTLKSTSTLRSGAVTFTEGDHRLLAKLKSQNKDSPFYAHRENSPEDEPKTPGGGIEEEERLISHHALKQNMNQFHIGTKGKGVTNAQADRNEIQSLWTVEEEAKQLIKVMNSFRHMELHAGGSPHLREPVVTSDSHRVVKVASAQDRVPLIRPSSAGNARSRGKFQELKKASAGNTQELAGQKTKAKGIEDPNVAIGAQGGYEDVVEALAGDITHNALVNTAVSETMCSRLSGRRGSRSSSASTTDSTEETIQWKKGNVLGKGAFGTVWCGLTNEGELIAVKQIELTTTDRCKAEFEYEKVQEEVELLKTLSHTNIVGYLGTSFEDNIVSIFMQFVPGGSIASILARFGALDEAVFRRYTRQILQGVEYLHSNDVIHRDIKGGNVMLMPNGVIKLIDFGCAKRLCINLSLSQTQILRSMKGTPYWMAPEVVNESGHGKKSDIWSIGCTVFEMATRKPPWAEMNPMAAIFAIGSDKPVPKLPNRFSLEAISFTERCLTRDQTQRPSASELLTDSFMLERIPKK